MNAAREHDEPVFRYQPERWPDAWSMFVTAAVLGANYLAWSLGAWNAPTLLSDLRGWWLAELLALITVPLLIGLSDLLKSGQSTSHPQPGARNVQLILSAMLVVFLVGGGIHEAMAMNLGLLFVVELLWLLVLELVNFRRAPAVAADLAVLRSVHQGLIALFAAVLGCFVLLPLQILWALFGVVYSFVEPSAGLQQAPPILALGLAFFLARGLLELYADREALWRHALRGAED